MDAEQEVISWIQGLMEGEVISWVYAILLATVIILITWIIDKVRGRQEEK